MTEKDRNLALFQEKTIRRTWKYGKWFFVIEDVVVALTDTQNPKDYINKIRRRDEFFREGYGQIVHTLKIETPGGRQKMNCADTKGILRIIQSIPSKKAEPFKQWLATVGSERIEEIQNPELAVARMRQIYEKKGYDRAWIQQRERNIATRNRLTDEWDERGAKKGLDYAILTNEIYRTGFGLDAKEYKNLKGLEKQDNLRDSMTEMELALTNLGETTATELHRSNNSRGMVELKYDVRQAGEVTKIARRAAEKRLKKSVVTDETPVLNDQSGVKEIPDEN
ncbi:Bro-N domain-containing protein [Candidatus Saccharibacteria bacterium]|nr:Bro-N domain-containing protein [Candidatus Saccharibacteria bacterium]